MGETRVGIVLFSCLLTGGIAEYIFNVYVKSEFVRQEKAGDILCKNPQPALASGTLPTPAA